MRFINKIFGILWLIRIPIVNVTILLALIALNFSNIHNLYYIIALACIFMAGYIQNDILDFEIDKISAPSRPLPSEIISIQEAKNLYKLLVVLGGCCGIISRKPFYVIYLFIILSMFYIYTKYCKSNWIIKNFFTAFFSTTVIFIPILCGGTINKETLCLGIIAFFFTIGREIFMDIRDREGDQLIINVKRPPIFLGYIMSILFLFTSFLIKEFFFFEIDILRYIIYVLIVLIMYFLFINKKSKYWIVSESIKIIFIYDLITIYIELQ